MTDIQTTMPVTPQGYVNDNNMGRGWGAGAGALGGGVVGLLLGSLLAGGGLFGGIGGNGAAQTILGLTNEGLALKTQTDVTNASMRLGDNLNAGFTTVNNGICGIQQTMLTGFGNLQHQGDLNTCRLETAIHAEGEATRALITQNEIQALRDRNVEQSAVISNLQQTASIVSAIKPCAVPAYFAPNPNVATFAAPYPYAAPFHGGGCNPCGPCGNW